MAGKVEIIGVYSLPVTDDLISTQTGELYDAPSASQVEQVRQQLRSTVLVEALVTDADAEFNIGDFAQEDPALPRENWQAPYAEALLTPDGEGLLVRRWGSLPPSTSNFRVAFYMHYWKPGRPLLSSYGSVATPPPTAMPERLAKLVPYITVD